MEPITLSFYAIVCGLLSLLSPSLRGIVKRFVFGAIVGVIAALSLPVVKAFLLG